MRQDMDRLRETLSHQDEPFEEMHERLDFAERFLAAGRASQEDRSGDRLSRGSRWQTTPKRPSGVRGFHFQNCRGLFRAAYPKKQHLIKPLPNRR